MHVERIQFCSHLVNLLLIFMPPWEVFAVMKHLIESSNKIMAEEKKQGGKKSGGQDEERLRWHIARNAKDHTHLISTFINFYVDRSVKKKRKTLIKCLEIGLNFDLLLHQMLNTLCTCVLPLDLAIHVAFIFVIEGQKALLRVCYAILKLSKPII